MVARSRRRALSRVSSSGGTTTAAASEGQLPPTGGLRVLFLGDSAGTGFGTVTRDLALAMVKRGCDVRIISMNEDLGATTDPSWPDALRGRMISLGIEGGWVGLRANGGEGAYKVLLRVMGIFQGHTVPGWTPEVALITADPASLEGSPWGELLPKDLPAFNYVPIEGIDLPPLWREMWKRFSPIAMTEFGAGEIEKIRGERPPVVYHGIDPESFWQVSPTRPLVMTGIDKKGKRVSHLLRSKADCRAYLEWPANATILFRSDRHMPRKNYGAMLRTLAPVLARHPEALMIIHCKTIDQGGSLWHEKSKYPPFIQQRIAFTGYHDRIGGVPRPLLMAMYNASDIYISTSAEGFGLTVAEALACGVPAVALNYSSLPEVVGDAGRLVDYHLIDNIYSYFWARPKEAEYAAAVEGLMTDRDERLRLGRLGPVQAAKFDWSVAAERMETILSGGSPATDATPPPVERRLSALGLVGARS